MMSDLYTVAKLALPDGKTMDARPANTAVLNRWLKFWTAAQVYRHDRRDGNTLYWFDGEATLFYSQTVHVTRTSDLTFREWYEDFMTRRAETAWNRAETYAEAMAAVDAL